MDAKSTSPPNLELLLDVRVKLTIELGSCQMPLREVLQLAFDAAQWVVYVAAAIAIAALLVTKVVASHILTSKSAASVGTLQRLAHDQRRVRVSLTARSRALAARMAPQIEAVYARVERLLGREFCNHLYGALDDLIAKLGTPSPP